MKDDGPIVKRPRELLTRERCCHELKMTIEEFKRLGLEPEGYYYECNAGGKIPLFARNKVEEVAS